MKVWLTRLGFGFGLLLIGLVLLALFTNALGERKRQRLVEVKVDGVPWTSDASTLERGHYLYRSRGCADCHGADGGGREFINDGKGMRLRGPNITMGAAAGRYSAQDWERVVRHGVKSDGRPAFIMPSEDYNRLTNADLAALVGYVRSLPARNGGETVVQLPMHVIALYGLGAIKDAFEKIDHNLAPAQPVTAAINSEHGAYVAQMCKGCHGPSLSGGTIPGGPPDWPAAANLTPGTGSVMVRYPDATSFVTMLRSGKRSDGSTIQVMPFESLRELNDIDAQALYAYLKVLPPKPSGQR